jgi:hypothetical protein
VDDVPIGSMVKILDENDNVLLQGQLFSFYADVQWTTGLLRHPYNYYPSPFIIPNGVGLTKGHKFHIVIDEENEEIRREKIDEQAFKIQAPKAKTISTSELALIIADNVLRGV